MAPPTDPLQPAIHAADARARRQLIAVIAAIAIAGVAGHWFLRDWVAGLKELEPAAALAALLRVLLIGTWVSALLISALAARCWRQGRRIEQASRYPLPEARLVRDTPVVEGPAARARGRLLRMLAGVLLLLAAASVAAAHMLAARFGAGA